MTETSPFVGADTRNEDARTRALTTCPVRPCGSPPQTRRSNDSYVDTFPPIGTLASRNVIDRKATEGALGFKEYYG